jgi:hypothetical protein
MSAVEGLSNRLAEPRALRIIYDHRCPRHRLKRDPMQPNRATERENRGNAAGAAKHDCEASERIARCQSWRNAGAERISPFFYEQRRHTAEDEKRN